MQNQKDHSLELAESIIKACESKLNSYGKDLSPEEKKEKSKIKACYCKYSMIHQNISKKHEHE